MQQRCPNCGSPIVPGQRFCGACGTQISLSCPQCRITVSPGTRFCPSCGTALVGGPPQQQPGWGQQQGWAPQPGGTPQQPGWGQQQPWGQQPGGMPQQPGWGQQPAWAPPAPSVQPSSARPFLVGLLIFLLIGLGGLVYWQFGDSIMALLKTFAGGTTTPVADTKPPELSDITHFVGPTSARIDWKTNEPASSQVEYGKTQNYGSFAPPQPQNDPTAIGPDGKPLSAGVVTHSVVLTGLEPNTTYHYRVKSKDKAGNEAISQDKTFKTTVPEE